MLCHVGIASHPLGVHCVHNARDIGYLPHWEYSRLTRAAEMVEAEEERMKARKEAVKKQHEADSAKKESSKAESKAESKADAKSSS